MRTAGFCLQTTHAIQLSFIIFCSTHCNMKSKFWVCSLTYFLCSSNRFLGKFKLWSIPKTQFLINTNGSNYQLMQSVDGCQRMRLLFLHESNRNLSLSMCVLNRQVRNTYSYAYGNTTQLSHPYAPLRIVCPSILYRLQPLSVIRHEIRCFAQCIHKTDIEFMCSGLMMSANVNNT